MEQKDEKEFTIRDRRSASSEQKESPKQPSGESAQKPADTDTATPQDQNNAMPLPELDFSTFVLTLATSTQINLGNMQDPRSGQASQNLPAAKQMIDILGILKEKTKGNLSKEEEMLLDSALYNLRMQYVKTVEGKK